MSRFIASFYSKTVLLFIFSFSQHLQNNYLLILGNDQEIEFHEIKIGIFKEILTLIRSLKLLSNDQEIEMALWALRGLG